MEKISCIVGTKNAQKDIGPCLEAVKWADEIVVIDDFSTDRTLEIARQYTDKIFQKKLEGWDEQRAFGIEKTTYDWVLALDADEIVTPKLQEEIKQKLRNTEGKSGFRIRRLNIFLGKEVKHCGWYKATVVRLFNKKKVRYNLNFKYQEVQEIDGPLGVMENDLIHYTCRSLEDYLNRVNLWSTLNTRDLVTKGIRITSFNSVYYFIFKPAAVFFQKYFLKAGYRDGFVGFLICALSGVTYLISYAKLWEIQRKG
jgi:glycosyltransferase involved in cell wall biosynthesis